MFSLFRRRTPRPSRFAWMPAVDVTNPRVTAALISLNFTGR